MRHLSENEIKRNKMLYKNKSLDEIFPISLSTNRSPCKKRAYLYSRKESHLEKRRCKIKRSREKVSGQHIVRNNVNMKNFPLVDTLELMDRGAWPTMIPAQSAVINID